MDRRNQIYNHKLYQEYLKKNEVAEADRRFCHHDMVHFLDVARLAMIMKHQQDINVSEDLIYAAALLHDIGRWQQYEDKIPHEQASARLAPTILRECGFDAGEEEMVIEAVSNHRNSEVKDAMDLNGLLYRADKMSRSCFACKTEADCNWKNDKKNYYIQW